MPHGVGWEVLVTDLSAGFLRCCLLADLLFPDAAPVGEVNNLQRFGSLNEIGQIKVDNVVANDDVRV